jgi:hypothetical protein
MADPGKARVHGLLISREYSWTALCRHVMFR